MTKNITCGAPRSLPNSFSTVGVKRATLSEAAIPHLPEGAGLSPLYRPAPSISGHKGGRIKRRNVQLPKEEDEQMAFVEWLRLENIPHTHVANEIGGSTPAMKARAMKMKRMGTSKGFPDLLVFIPVYGVTGEIDAYQLCGIEMKRRKNSRVTAEQKEWLERLQASGAMCAVCHGADEAIAFVESIRKVVNGE